MIEVKMPKKCKECNFIRAYINGVWVRNPHYCCELIYDLYDEDYKVNPDTIDEKCPLKKGIVAV